MVVALVPNLRALGGRPCRILASRGNRIAVMRSPLLTTASSRLALEFYARFVSRNTVCLLGRVEDRENPGKRNGSRIVAVRRGGLFLQMFGLWSSAAKLNYGYILFLSSWIYPETWPPRHYILYFPKRHQTTPSPNPVKLHLQNAQSPPVLLRPTGTILSDCAEYCVSLYAMVLKPPPSAFLALYHNVGKINVELAKQMASVMQRPQIALV